MNARYVLDEDPYALGEHFGVRVESNLAPRYNIAPSQPVPIVRAGARGGREWVLVRWGFVPGWDRKGAFFKRAIVNIRSETAAEKPSFRHAWRRRHCLFPMNGFYEWTEEADGKQPFFFALSEDRPLFCLGGLWEHWLGEDGSEMETAAFLTREAPYPLTEGNDRMPVFVPPERYDDWLSTDETDLTGMEDILRLPQPDLVHWPVSRRVNSWKAEGRGLTERIVWGRQQSLL